MVRENSGVWLLPTKGRPNSLARFLKCYRETKCSTPLSVIVGDPQDSLEFTEYLEVCLAKGKSLPWELESFRYGFFEPVQCMGASIRRWMATNNWKNMDWIGLVNDDQIPVTEEWDKKLIATLNGKNFVSCDDLVQGDRRMAGAFVWSVPLLKAVGYIYPPKLHHMFMDDMWENIGLSTGTWNKRLDVLVEHAHWSHMATPGRRSEFDATAKSSQSFFDIDKKIYQEWAMTEFQKVVKRVKTFLQQ